MFSNNNNNNNNYNNNKETESINNKNAHNSDLLEIAKKLAINSTNIIKSSFNTSFKPSNNITTNTNINNNTNSAESFLSSLATKTANFINNQSKETTNTYTTKTISQIFNTSNRFSGSMSSVASTPSTTPSSSIVFHHHHYQSETKRLDQSKNNHEDDLHPKIGKQNEMNIIDNRNSGNINTKSTHLEAISQYHKQQLFQKSSTSNSSFNKFNFTKTKSNEIVIAVDDTEKDKQTIEASSNTANTNNSNSYLSIKNESPKPHITRYSKSNDSFKIRSNSVNISNQSSESASTSSSSNLNRCILKNLTRETNHFSYVIEAEGFIQLNQYKLKNEIGKGSYGIVKLAYNDQDNRNYAMKMISKKKLIKKSCLLRRAPSRQNSSGTYNSSSPNQNYMLDRVYKEIAILKKLDHQNVVKLIEVLDDPNEDYLCLAFEYFEKGTLIDIPTDYPLPEHIAWKYFRELMLGIEYLHYQKIIHRDIKPSNLLLGNDNHIKIADFGVSNEFDGDDAIISNSLGTPAFTPPEAITEHSLSWLGKPVDLWASGITLYAFVYGHVPFHDDCLIALRNKILHNTVVFPEEPKISVSLKDLILKLLNKDPNKRIKMDSIKKHKWVVMHPIKNEYCPFTNNNEIKPITVTEDEVKNSIVSLSKLDTLIFIKSMIKKRSFTNPYRMHLSSLSNSNSIDIAN